MAKVQLAVYDLSMGMSAAMSQQIVGIHIPLIPHTGVVVFGIEYFFGGGIQMQPFGSFSASCGMQPVQMLDLGTTNKSKQELESFLRSVNHQFTQQTYNLLTHNCNNFSDRVLEFLSVGTRVPSYILDLPATVMSTPLGRQLLGPMMSNFQQNQSSFGGDPFASMGAENGQSSFSLGSSSSIYQGTPPGVGVRLGSGSASVQASSTLYTPSSSSTSTSSSSSSSSSSFPHSSSLDALVPCKLQRVPSISSDASSVDALAQKICKLQQEHQESMLTEVEIKLLLQAVEIVKNKEGGGIGAQPTNLDVSYFEKIFKAQPQGHVAALFILRLIVLTANFAFFSREGIASLLTILLDKLELGDRETESPSSLRPFESLNAQVMALTVLANALSHLAGVQLLFQSLSLSERLLDLALRSMTQQTAPPQVKQMASALALNVAILCTTGSAQSGEKGKGWIVPGTGNDCNEEEEGEMHAHAVQLLCGCLDGVLYEQDALVRKRRLTISLLIVRSYGSTAATLCRDLGFTDPLSVHLTSLPHKSVPADLESEDSIMRELVFLMR